MARGQRARGKVIMTSGCNNVTLLGRLADPGAVPLFSPQTGTHASFTLLLERATLVLGVTDCVAVPCEVTGALARLAARLMPGALVWITGALAMRDAELGEDTGRLVVVGTALTVVVAGEVIKD